jgi:hypothetical protein
MGSRTVSRREAEEIADALDGTIRDLEGRGHDRSSIGACMVGIGAGIVAVRDGREVLFRILDDARLTVEADGVRKN